MKTYLKTIRLASLALLILLLTLPLTALAAEDKVDYDATVAFGEVKGAVGDVVDVPVKLDQVKKDIAAYGMEINFDEDHVKIVGIQSGYGNPSANCSNETAGCFWSNYSNTDGFVRVAWADPTAGDHPINKSVNLFTVQVEILKTDFIGESNLSVQVKNLESLSFTGPSNDLLSVGVDTGKLKIVEPSKTDSTKGTKSSDDKTNLESLPKTGDDSYIDTILNIGIAVLAATLLFMWFYKRRQKTEKYSK